LPKAESSLPLRRRGDSTICEAVIPASPIAAVLKPTRRISEAVFANRLAENNQVLFNYRTPQAASPDF
jgi:hypothetical protein